MSLNNQGSRGAAGNSASRSSHIIDFLPGKLPSNEYAFKNMLFMNPEDFQYYLQHNGNRKPVFVKVKTMILRLEALDSINVGEVAASSIQKEAMRISKIDNIRVEPYRVKDENPL